MSRLSRIVLAVLLVAGSPGCDREPTYRDRPISHWVEASGSPNVQTRQQAIGALLAFPKDARASVRLQQIRLETLARREGNWAKLRAWLQDADKTREHRSTITTYIDSMPESEEGIVQYTPTAFPGKWQEMRDILLKRVEQTSGDDRDLYQAFLRIR